MQTNRSKTLFHEISPQHTMYMWENLKKKTATSNHRFLLMLGEFKSDQLLVEKTKLANNLYMENLNHLSWNKSPTNYVQQII